MRKIVGLIPLYDDERESYWMIPGYMKMLEAVDAIPLMLPLTDNHDELDYFVETCGGFVLTGGHDVSPEIYNAKKQPYCGISCEAISLRSQLNLISLFLESVAESSL